MAGLRVEALEYEMATDAGQAVEAPPTLTRALTGRSDVGRPFRMVPSSFFSLGSSTMIAWDSIYMSLSYFEQLLGKEVLSVLSLCFSLPLFFAMSSCLLLRRQPRLRTMEVVTKVCCAYMLVVCIAVFAVVATGCRVPAGVFCALVAGCGVASGLMQSMVASISAVFTQLSPGCGAGTSALTGSGGVILVPMMVQMLLIPVDMLGYPTINLSVLIIFPLAICILLTTYGSLWLLSGSTVWSVATADLDAAATGGPVEYTIGNVGTEFTRRRVALTGWCGLGEIITLAVTGFLLSLTPHMTPCSNRDLGFWQRYLATILVSAHTTANFLGRAVVGGTSLRPVCTSVPVLCLLVLARLGFVPFIIAYARSGSSCLVFTGDGLNIGITCTYFVMSFSGGAVTMLLSRKAQWLCQHTPELPCPITSQLIWLTIQLGSLLGVALSYIKVE